MGAAAYSIQGLRIAPVCDTADMVLVIPSTGNTLQVCRHQYPTFEEFLDRLEELEVDTLVCGALSRDLQYRFAAHEITAIPFICGKVSCVIEAYQAGVNLHECFAMPGCRCMNGRTRRTRRQRHARI